ncbi:MAG TPA: hypothetical protein ENH55_13860 [Aurantimonas coralicida]|uniref:Uncharacterized protein n=2 Tax=root TaxID=1 RepID=A0A9C9NGS6_9HYPH|nr:hypothetical protein [Aurantimonas coralicida]HEU00973.1 hypothetical protein [Aurantimonas coralicida]
MTATLFGSDKGGIGKDLLTEAYLLASQWHNQNCRLIELETLPRLSRIYPDATHVSITPPTAEAVYQNADIIFEPLDRAAEIWRSENNSVTSLGANVTSSLITWARADGARLLDEGEGMTIAIVLTMNAAAMSAGLGNLYDVGEILPKARRVAVLNDLHGEILERDEQLFSRLRDAQGDARAIETIRIPRCAAPGWGYAQGAGSLRQIAELAPERLVAMGMPEGAARRSMAMITQWIVDGLVRPLETLLPVEVSKKPGRGKGGSSDGG